MANHTVLSRVYVRRDEHFTRTFNFLFVDKLNFVQVSDTYGKKLILNLNLKTFDLL